MSQRSMTVVSLLLPVLLCAALTLSGAQADGSGLEPFTAKYKIGNDTMTAGLIYNKLSRDGERWRYKSNTDPSFLASLYGPATATAISLLEMHEGTLREVKFTYRDEDSKKKAHTDGDFDWDKKLLTVKYGGKDKTFELDEPIYDEASASLAVGLALRAGAQEVTVSMLAKGKIKTQTFRNEGEEQVEVPAGKFSGIRMREVRPPGKRFTTAWYVPELGYLPVRMEQFNKGKLVARTVLLKFTRD